jgi:uncharacterized HAD superfamily protein
MINYRSVADLNAAILNGLHRVPKSVELVVGVPRSGLLAANLLALYLNCPLTDVDAYLAGRTFRAGPRATQGIRGPRSNPPLTLIFDDSINTGSQMINIRKEIEAAGRQEDVIYGAVYASPEARSMVDVFFETIPQPRIFQWNVLHSHVLADSCVDIDGVLCCDPLDHENDDGPAYEKFLLTAERKYFPTVEIGWLVTCRLEKYRSQTERWLRANGVSYRELIMLDLPSKEARIAANVHGKYKADVYMRSGASLFVESSKRQAIEISRLSSKQVLCTETWEMEIGDASQTSTAIGNAAMRMLKGCLPNPAKELLRGALAGQRK